MAVLGPCQATIVALSNVLGANNPRVDNAGTIYALLDAQNRSVGTTPDPSNGRNDGVASFDETDGYPVVEVRNYQRSTEATRQVPSCVGSGVPLQKKYVKITMYRETALTFSWKQMQGLCGDAAKTLNASKRELGILKFTTENTPMMADIAAQIMSKVYKLVADINNDLNQKLALKAGVNRRTGLNTAKNYYVWTADDKKNSRGYNELLTDYDANGFGGTPIMLGGYDASMFAREMRWGSYSAAGTDYAKIATQDPFRFYLDKNADLNFGQDQFLLLAPGAAKLLTYNQYGTDSGVTPFAGPWGTGEFGQFSIAEFGDDLRFDLHVEKATCPGPTGLVIVSLYYDLYVPEGIFATGDPNAGVNGIIKGKTAHLVAA